MSPVRKTDYMPVGCRGMRTLLLAAPIAALVCVAACSTGSPSGSLPAIPDPTPTTPPLITTGGPSGMGPGREICAVTDSAAGTYYLLVTSETVNDLSACQGGTPFKGTVDDLLRLPRMDRRCILPTDGGSAAMRRFHAIVAVYSSADHADLAAAGGFCRANGGTN